MDAFEESLQTFNSTIYGSEMRESLHECFRLIGVEIDFYNGKLSEIEAKISEAEGR